MMAIVRILLIIQEVVNRVLSHFFAEVGMDVSQLASHSILVLVRITIRIHEFLNGIIPILANVCALGCWCIIFDVFAVSSRKVKDYYECYQWTVPTSNKQTQHHSDEAFSSGRCAVRASMLRDSTQVKQRRSGFRIFGGL